MSSWLCFSRVFAAIGGDVLLPTIISNCTSKVESHSSHFVIMQLCFTLLTALQLFFFCFYSAINTITWSTDVIKKHVVCFHRMNEILVSSASGSWVVLKSQLWVQFVCYCLVFLLSLCLAGQQSHSQAVPAGSQQPRCQGSLMCLQEENFFFFFFKTDLHLHPQALANDVTISANKKNIFLELLFYSICITTV